MVTQSAYQSTNQSNHQSTGRTSGPSAVLVTGGAGYIGSHVVWELISSGRKVVIVDNLSTGDLRNLPAGVTFIEADIFDSEEIEAILRSHEIDSVLHFAASIKADESVTRPLHYFSQNTAGTLSLLQACEAAQVKNFIFSSTAAVYGSSASGRVTEQSPINPLSPYGESKRMSEIILRDYAKVSRLRYVCLRYFNVAGVHPRMRSGTRTSECQHLIVQACRAALGVIPYFDVYGVDYPTADGTCVRDFIHVADLATAHVEALDYLERGGDSITLNCGYGRGHSVLEVVRLAQQLIGLFNVRHASRRVGDPEMLIAETDLLRKTLPSWTPQFDQLETIMKTAAIWQRLTHLKTSVSVNEARGLT